MEMLDNEIVQRRAEYERSLVRNAEVQLHQRSSSLRVTESQAAQERSAFEAAFGAARSRVERERSERPGHTNSSPRLILECCEAAVKRAQHIGADARTAASSAGLKLREQRDTVAQATQSLGLHRQRAECLDEMVRVLGRKKAIQSEFAQADELTQLVGSRRQCDKTKKSSAGAFEHLKESEMPCSSAESVASVEPLAVSAPESNLANLAGLSEGNAGMGQGSSESRDQRNFNSPGSAPEARGESARVLEWKQALAAHLQKNSETSGVETDAQGAPKSVRFGYQLEGGRVVQVQISRSVEGQVSMMIAPEKLADRHLLSRSLREVRAALTRKGYQVCDGDREQPRNQQGYLRR